MNLLIQVPSVQFCVEFREFRVEFRDLNLDVVFPIDLVEP